MQSTDRINGSPHDEACANIDSQGTANNSSPSKVIRSATDERHAGVVPLYLVQQVVAAEVARYGRAVREIHVVRTGCHFYSITTVAGQEAVSHD